MSDEVKRVVFYGEKPLALECLKTIHGLDNVVIIGVVSRQPPDNAWWQGAPLWAFCDRNGISLIEPEDAEKYKCDAIVSVLYHEKISSKAIKNAKRAINLHLAPLPEYRGCNCGTHAIIEGNESFGVTIHEISEGIDEGGIIDVARTAIHPKDTAESLYHRCERIGSILFESWIENILNGNYLTTPQGEGTFYKRSCLDNLRCADGLKGEALYDRARAFQFNGYEHAYITTPSGKVYISIGE